MIEGKLGVSTGIVIDRRMINPRLAAERVGNQIGTHGLDRLSTVLETTLGEEDPDIRKGLIWGFSLASAGVSMERALQPGVPVSANLLGTRQIKLALATQKYLETATKLIEEVTSTQPQEPTQL